MSFQILRVSALSCSINHALNLARSRCFAQVIASSFGKLTALVTDGHLPYPYGRELTGYEVANLADTLAKAKGAGATILVVPYQSDQRQAAIVQFPGGYIAEIHSLVKK